MSTSVRFAAHSAPYTTTTASATAATITTTWSSKQHRSSGGAARALNVDSHTAVDNYAQRVLIKAARDAQKNDHTNDDINGRCIMIDDSLGPYVTSCLRNSKTNGTITDVTELVEFDCLCELIQEHCQIDQRSSAVPILQRIAEAVFSGVIPDDDDTIPKDTTRESSSRLGGDIPCNTPSVQLQLDEAHNRFSSLSLSSRDTLTSTGSSSDQRIDATGTKYTPTQLTASTTSLSSQTVFEPSSRHLESSSHDPVPLTANNAPVEQSSAVHHNLLHGATNLTASVSSLSAPLEESEIPFDADLYHQQMVAHYIHSIHTDISENAAWEATTMAQGHWNVASHLIECASNQLPLCRNMLAHGCYRADCSFSHDRERHTCLFWLRSKCTKHADCAFRHGFDPDHLDTAPEPDMTSFYDPSYETGDIYHSDYHDVNGSDYHGDNRTAQSNGSSSSLWIPNPPPSQPASSSRAASASTPSSFANIASKGYDPTSFADHANSNSAQSRSAPITTVRIPQSLWSPHEQRCDASAFYIADPLERYRTVNAHYKAANVMDLHFQSLQTFAVVVDAILPTKLTQYESIWIITGTGHSVGTQTHQKGGGALEAAVLEYVLTYYSGPTVTVQQGRDRNGQGGAILVQSKGAKATAAIR